MEKMTSKNYVENVLRTESTDFEMIRHRIIQKGTLRLLHAAMGLGTEAAEFLDMLKKHIFYGKPLDLVNAREEVGDTMWYAALAIDVLKTTLNEVMTVNIAKLRKRYPEKFTEDDAINRDLDAEKQILCDHAAETIICTDHEGKGGRECAGCGKRWTEAEFHNWLNTFAEDL